MIIGLGFIPSGQIPTKPVQRLSLLDTGINACDLNFSGVTTTYGWVFIYSHTPVSSIFKIKRPFIPIKTVFNCSKYKSISFSETSRRLSSFIFAKEVV